MHQFLFSERRVWATRAPMSVALACIGLLLLAAARNDHWSATVGVAIARCAIGGAAGIAARPILTAALTSMGLRRAALALPRLLMASFTIGVSVCAAGDVSERALVAAYLTLPGSSSTRCFAGAKPLHLLYLQANRNTPMITIALDGFATHAVHPLPPLAQQHLDAFAAQEGYALLTLQMQRQQADYLLLRGCDGCSRDACVVGCRAALLRRALAITLPGVTPRVLRHPLRQRPFRYSLLAWPRRGATPLDRSLLDEAEEMAVHLAVHREGDGVRTIALIGISAVEVEQRHNLLQFVRERGWRTAVLPGVVHGAFTRLLYGLPLIRGTRGDWKPHLFTHTGAAFTPSPPLAPADAVGAAMSNASGRADIPAISVEER